MRVVSQVLLALIAPTAVAAGQLAGGIGPVGRVSSAASAWQPSASLWGAARLEHPFANLQLEGSLMRSEAAFRAGSLSGIQQFFTPAFHGVRSVTSLEFERTDPLLPSRTSGTSSLSYRRGTSGGWLGVKAEQSSTSSLRMGGWRQIREALTLAVSSSLRRGTFGATPSRFWTEPFKDSVLTDSGWVTVIQDRLYGDSGSAGRKLSWLETEAKVGWTVRRVSFDGVVGWRPAIDSSAKSASWARAIATVALARSVSLSAGVGTTMRQIPYARPAGRYASIGIRLAPAALMRPKETPEITPAIAAFEVEPSGDHYLVRVRLPRARVVELSGDFNGWKPIRLTREIDDSWTATLDLAPGAYRMNLRIDGERWLPPPGMPAVDDEFNGKVGLVVVR